MYGYGGYGGMGRGQGGRGRRGGGRGAGRQGSGAGAGGGYGPAGYCICLRCGYRVPKQPGVPCREMRCPNCGAVLVREGGYHHQLFLEKTKGKRAP